MTVGIFLGWTFCVIAGLVFGYLYSHNYFDWLNKSALPIIIKVPLAIAPFFVGVTAISEIAKLIFKLG